MKIKPQQVLMAALPVVVGVILLNNIKRLAGSSVVGKVIDGSLIRPA